MGWDDQNWRGRTACWLDPFVPDDFHSEERAGSGDGNLRTGALRPRPGSGMKAAKYPGQDKATPFPDCRESEHGWRLVVD